VAVNPHTPVSFLREIIADIDLICLMSVNPGFGGQKFIENTYTKVRELKVLIQERKSNALIEIDGGVNTENAALLAAAGADAFVAGSFVFSSANPKETIQRLKDIKK
jgi:ribulose-phosphate 3-epimerase